MKAILCLSPEGIFKKLYFGALLVLMNTVVSGQTAETEPNNNNSQSGVITISVQSTITGSVHVTGGDPTDWWWIADGSSGTVIATWSDNVRVFLRSYTNSGRTGIPTTTELTSGVASSSLSASLFYSLTIQFVTPASLTNYSVALSGTALPAGDPEVILSASPGSAAEDGGSVVLTATADIAPGSDLTVNLSYSGTAVSGVDYTPVATIVISSGTTSGMATLNFIADTQDEPDETIIAEITGFSGTTAKIGSPDQVSVTINDDDNAPEITIGDVTVSEGSAGNTSYNFPVSLSNSSSQTVTVNYSTSNGTAIAGSDYTSVSNQTITFSAGDVMENATVLVSGDLVDELDETFTVQLSSPSNATLGTPLSATGTITNDDTAFEPNITFSINNNSPNEGGNQYLRGLLSGITGRDVTVNFNVLTGNADDAVQGGDYTLTGGGSSFTIREGDTADSIAIVANNDALIEGNETVRFSITSVDGADESSASLNQTVIINDMDAATVSIDDVSLTEADAGTQSYTFTVTANTGGNTIPNGFSVGYATSDVTATVADSDYTAASGTLNFSGSNGETETLTVTVNGDVRDEENETFQVTLSNIQTVNGEDITFSDNIASGTISDNDPQPTLSISDASITEGNAGTTNATFNISLSTASGKTITVDYATSDGTATVADSDYDQVLASNVTFLPGETSKSIDITINGDLLVEEDETFFVDLSNPSNTTLLDSQGQGTLTNDDTAELSIVATTQAAEDMTCGLFTVSTTSQFSNAVTVNISITGTATDGTDYSSLGTSFVFPANTSTATLPLNVLSDDLVEADETVIVTLTGTDNTDVIVGVTDNATITITDNDTALLSIAATAQAAEDATDGVFTLTTSNPFSSAVTVDFTVAGSAMEGTDYTTIGTQVTFPANQSTTTIPVEVIADNVIETDETVLITLTGTNNADVTIGVNDEATVTITDDDAAVLSIVATTQAGEDATDGVFTISTTNPFTTATNVTFSISGTATSGTDYTALGSSFTIPANTSSVTLTVPVLADGLVEADETVIVTLTGTDNADVTISATNTATVTITDDDAAVLSILATTQAAEDVTNGLFTINSSNQFSDPVTVNISVTGTAADGTDYSSLGTSFVFPANASTTTVPLSVISDNLVEADETVIITLTGTDNADVTVGATNNATVTITDNDTALLSIAATNQAAEDATDGVFTLTTTNPFSTSVAVDITVTGSATEGTDYTTIGTQVIFPANQNTTTIPVDVIADNIIESNETVSVTLTGTNNADVAIGTGNTADLTITDDDAAVLTIIATTQAGEDATNGVFTVSTTNQFTTATSVTFSVSGTATSGIDYNTLGTSFTFPANTNSVMITVPVIADNLVENDETVILTLTGTDNADVTIGPANAATVTITDDDTAGLSIAATTQAVEDVTSGLFTVSTTSQFSNAVTVNISVTGTATDGTDYSSLGTSFVFPANTSATTIPLNVLSDDLVEADETVVVTLTGTDNTDVTVGVTDNATITITDNDTALLSIAAATQAAEDATDGVFTLTTSNLFSSAVTVDITVAGSATEGTDYTTIGTQVTFPANQSTTTIPVEVIADNIIESNEMVMVTLTGTNNADVTIGVSDEATVTITDDDAAVLSIVATTQAGEDATDGVFTISTTNPFTTATNVTFSVSGTATSGIDYTALGTSFIFPANSNSVTLNVVTISDELDEENETIVLTLTGTDNSDITVGTVDNATITITDDDETPVITPLQTYFVDENAANSFSPGSIVVTDTDTGTSFSNWTIRSGNDEGIWNVNNNGEIAIADNSNLDREVTGSYTLSVTVSDGTNTSAPEDVVINVNDVNDELPEVVSGQIFTITEGIANGSVLGTLTASDADVSPTTFQDWSIGNGNTSTDGDADLPFLLDAVSGELSINDADDINLLMVTFTLDVTVGDGVNTSTSNTVVINVLTVNDAPSFSSGNDQTVSEDAGSRVIPGWATDILAGPSDESAQVLNFQVTNDNPDLFEEQPSVSANGTLSFTTAVNEFGTANLTLFLTDDGGTDNGGLDRSVDQTFTITVDPVNDAPDFTLGADQLVIAGMADYSIDNWATEISPGPANESGQQVSFNVTNDNASLFSSPPSIDTDGTLTYSVNENVSGSALVSVTLSDNGGTAGGGSDESSIKTFTIEVGRLSQVITFESLEDKKVGSDPVGLVASGGNSGLPVTFSITTEPVSGVASLMDTMVIIEGPGNVVITAMQEGNETYQPAEDVSRSFMVIANELFLPTLFSPNKDDVNDRFVIRGGGNVADIEFNVFNRDGNLVFRSESWTELSQTGWDGTSNGTDQPQGAYVWMIKGTFRNGEPLLVNGQETGVIRLAR